jgi:hypothetical protein
VNGSQRPERRPDDGHALSVERVIGAPYEDAFSLSTTVDITIEAVPDGHRLRLVKYGFPTAATRDDFAGAWPDVLGELAGRVSS